MLPVTPTFKKYISEVLTSLLSSACCIQKVNIIGDKRESLHTDKDQSICTQTQHTSENETSRGQTQCSLISRLWEEKFEVKYGDTTSNLGGL